MSHFRICAPKGRLLLSAVRKDGKTRWVSVESFAGQPCVIEPGLPERFKIRGVSPSKLRPLGKGLYALQLNKGEKALLSADEEPVPAVQPVDAPGPRNYYGLKASRE